jgi:YVTN family beta-propeller protein
MNHHFFKRSGIAVFLAFTAPLFALHVVATIPVGTGVNTIAVNSKTNRIYVANSVAGSVAVIDGFTNRLIASIPVGAIPQGIAVNSITNRIYVLNTSDQSMSVIDGNTNSVTTTVPEIPGTIIAVNSLTNRMYVADQANDQVHVVSGNNNSIIADLDVQTPGGLVVSSSTNLVYGMSVCACNVFVIDGVSNQFLNPILVPGSPTTFGGIALDEKSNFLYVPTVPTGGQAEIAVLSTLDNSYLGSIPGVGVVNGLAALPGVGQVVTTGGIDPSHRTIVLSDANKLKVLRSLRVGRGPVGTAYDSANQFTYVANSADGTVVVVSKN